jgi:hypothetical protein
MSYDYSRNAHPAFSQGSHAQHQPSQQAGQTAAPAHQHAADGLYGYEAEGPYGLESWFNFRNTGYLKGFAVGAGVALVLTNSAVQKALVAGAVKLWSAVQGGVEEVKEQIQDIKAEMSQKD